MIFNELDRAIIKAAYEYGQDGVVSLDTAHLIMSLGGDMNAIDAQLQITSDEVAHWDPA